jgi:thiamine biosynthesis lipoprotein
MRICNYKPCRLGVIFLFFSITVSCLLFSVFACAPQKERVFKKSRSVMDTFVTITVVARTSTGADEAIDKAFHEIERLEKAATFYSPDSEISRINLNAGTSPVKVSPDILDLLTKARQVSEVTDGAFDLSIGPVISLYDFRNEINPGNSEVREALSLVGYRNMSINREQSTVFLRKSGMLIDAGGIMKGYAAGRAAEVLKKHGIRSGIVAVAGDIRTFGLKPDGKPWRVGIRHPRGKGQDDIIGVIQLSDMSISTSGDYERFFVLNGRRIHHLISPKTGYPAEGCQSVSIVSPDGAFADAYSTAIFILGPEKGLKAIEKAGLEGIIIDRNGIVHATPGIRGYLELTESL